MTKRSARPGQNTGLLKTMLVVGSVAATLVGTRLLAVNESVGETAVSEPIPVIIVESAPANALPMPPNRNGGQTIVLDMAPIPQVITPNINPVQVQPVQRMQPVARTKSS